MAESPSPEESLILDAELHADSRLRTIQRRMQEEEGVRLTIDNIAYILKLNEEFAEDADA
jgi:hypothetical protein